jgi:hypothetical protein
MRAASSELLAFCTIVSSMIGADGNLGINDHR